MIGSRTRSREIALQVLFAADVRPAEATGAPDPTTLQDAEASADVKAFASELSEGVLATCVDIDALIATAAENWEIRRLATVDRCILRLAVYELMHRPDIPPKVSINEAIELGKRYSTAQSGGFINGILDRVRKDLGVNVDADDLDFTEADLTPGIRDVTPGVQESAPAAPDATTADATDIGRDTSDLAPGSDSDSGKPS